MRMTDAEMAAADAAYAALPGTPPDGWSFIPTEEVGDDPDKRYAAMRDRLDLWKPEMSFARVTVTDGPYATDGWPEGIWIEVWKTAPAKQAEFNPPVTAGPVQ